MAHQFREMDSAHAQDVKQLNGRMSAPERKGRDVPDRSPRALLFQYLSYLFRPLLKVSRLAPQNARALSQRCKQGQGRNRNGHRNSSKCHSTFGTEMKQEKANAEMRG